MDSLIDIIRKKKFGTLKQTYYWFEKHYPNKSKSEIKRAFNEYHSNRYVKKYNKSLMGNKFSAIRGIYQMDIYFTEEWKTPYLLLINVNTKYAWCKKIKSKNTDDVLPAFKQFVSEHHPFGIECDAEKAFTSYKFVDYCRNNNIKLKVSLNSLHSDLSVINRLCRTLRSLTESDSHNPNIEYYIKKYNKRFHETIDMAPRDMQFNTNNELRYIYNKLKERDEKNKLLLEDSIEKHDKVRYILDEKDKHFHKNEHKHKLSKYYYLVENVHSPYLFDIIASDGSVKTVPRYRLYKINKSEQKTFKFAPTIEDESNFMIYDEITDYIPAINKDGKINIPKSKYTVRVISRDKTGKKIKKLLNLGIMEVRVERPTQMSKMEYEFYLKNKPKYKLDKSTELLYPK